MLIIVKFTYIEITIFNVFIYYILNIFLDILRLYKRLDIVIQQIVKDELIEAIRLYIKNIVLEIETFIENRESIVALVRFSLVNLLIDYTNYLNLFLEIRPLIKVNIYLEREKIILSREESS